MKSFDELERALRHIGLTVHVGCVEHDESNIKVQFWLPDTYVFREPVKAPSPRPDEPKIDIDKMRRIGSAPAMASGDAKGPDGSFNTGMSLRMWLAGQMMSGIMASGNHDDRLIRAAFTYADDMILESLK